MEIRKNWNTQNILRKKQKVQGLTLLNFKTHYTAMVINTVWYWHKTKSMKQNRGSTNTFICVQLIFYKDSKAIYQEKEVFSTNARKNLYPNGKRKKETNLKKAYISFMYTLKKKQKTSYKSIFKRKQPNKRMGKKCEHFTEEEI